MTFFPGALGPPWRVPVFYNDHNEPCTKCLYYREVVAECLPKEPPRLAKAAYESHLIRGSHTTEPIVII